MSNESKIESAINLLAAEVRAGMNADAALKFTQAALNLAHVLSTQAATRTVK